MTPQTKRHKPASCVLLLTILVILLFRQALAHGVGEQSQLFLSQNQGEAFFPFLYIGAKHMVTGYDHLLFLIGVLFFVFRSKDVIIYVSCFTIGHSLTLLSGVWFNWQVNPFLVDAVIGFSVIYKGFDNLGGFKTLLGRQPNTKVAVLVFGLIHGLGLATKLQEMQLHADGLLVNLIAFNIGVEVGQVIALLFVLIMLNIWRHHRSFIRFSVFANAFLICTGLLLSLYQLSAYHYHAI